MGKEPKLRKEHVQLDVTREQRSLDHVQALSVDNDGPQRSHRLIYKYSILLLLLLNLIKGVKFGLGIHRISVSVALCCHSSLFVYFSLSYCTTSKFTFTDFSKCTEMFFHHIYGHLRTLKLSWPVKALTDP